MRRIGFNHPYLGVDSDCFIIAEAGINHNGQMELARELIDAAVAAGVDAIKFQTFKSEKVVSRVAPKANYQKEATGANESQLEMAKRLELSFDHFRELQAYCQEKGIIFVSTPFDEESVDFLDGLDVPFFKIPSGEINNLPFLEYISRKGRPMILSTGMSTLAEVETAVGLLESTGNSDLVLLHCLSNYPANPAEANLKAMQTMQTAFGVPVGYSDHTLGHEVALAAVALGACVLEKHFTLDCALPGPDHQASLEPDALQQLVAGIRIVESALGNGRKRPMPSEANTAAVARKSLVAARDLPAGTLLKDAMIASKRPGTGLPPTMRSNLVGRTLREAVSADTLFALEMVQ